MQKIPQFAICLAAAAIAASAPAQYAPNQYAANQYAANQYAPAPYQGAPITRTNPNRPQLFDLQPSPGVSVRSDVANGVQTVTATAALTELCITQGRADVTIHHPADHSEILIDLPGGQVSLLKDGFYTFNAATNTIRTLRGEAQVYNTANPDSRGAKVKETQQLAFFPNVKLKAVDAYPYELTADLLPMDNQNRGDGTLRGEGPGYGFYGEGFYPAYGYGYAYPYAYGYPFGLGLGFGYYGGFGYRGGFRR